MAYYLAYFICGMLVGFCGGLFGIGGGIIGIPILYALLSWQGIPDDLAMHVAVGTMLATVIITSFASIYTHYKSGKIVFPVLKRIVIGTALGCIMGALISMRLHGDSLQWMFALFLVAIGLRMLLPFSITPADRAFSTQYMISSTLVLGTFTGMLGLGGGILMVPYLQWRGLPIRNAVATSSACILPVSFIGTIVFLTANVPAGNVLLPHSQGFIYWPAFIGIGLGSILFAPLGARMTHWLPANLLRILFAVLILSIAVSMLVTAH